MKIESKTADAILERKHKIEIGAHSFDMPHPTLATMIMVSELTADLPNLFDDNLSVIDWALHNADKSRKLARILGVFVLGAKRVQECHKIPVERKEIGKKRKFMGVTWGKVEKTSTKWIDELDWFEDLIIDIMSPKELGLTLYHCMSMLEVKDFFAVTVSLSGANLTKRTEAVIASGD